MLKLKSLNDNLFKKFEGSSINSIYIFGGKPGDATSKNGGTICDKETKSTCGCEEIEVVDCPSA